jgi:hypothetical protein
MILIKIKGGLGNQLFQYATAFALSREFNTDLILDLDFFTSENNENPRREFELNKFNILYKNKFDRFKFLKNLIPNKLKFIENNFNYNKISYSKPFLYMEGYFQSEKYFTKYRNEIINQFTLKNKLSTSAQLILNLINSTNNSISLHIRRGDYLNENNSIYNQCSLVYYKNAISYITNTLYNYKLFLFSDDIEWCKTKFNFLNDKVYYCDLNTKPEEDIILMSSCKHNIIANSSFSWWGAWLNLNEKKCIVAPEKWFNTSDLNTQDLIPKNWIKIKNN